MTGERPGAGGRIRSRRIRSQPRRRVPPRLAELTGQPGHDVAVVLGSGWSPAADALARGLDATVTQVPVADLGGFRPGPCPATPARPCPW